MSEIHALNQQFAIPGVAEIAPGHGGLPSIQISAREICTGAVYLHGAHVAQWRPAGFDEVLWLSDKSAWENGNAIRGGVPICFPWFGPRKDYPQSPAHGFARLREWTLESLSQTAAGISVVLAFKSDAATLEQWPSAFVLRHRITFGRELSMELELTNTGNVPLTAEEAQHTYFSVGDVRQIRIAGLEGTRYIDKVDGFKEKKQSGEITITSETDRVYLDTAAPVTLADPVKRRRITVHKENSLATVVWNPWIAKAKAMPDFGDEEWPHMACIETASVGAYSITLAPGQIQTMRSRIAVQPA